MNPVRACVCAVLLAVCATVAAAEPTVYFLRAGSLWVKPADRGAERAVCSVKTGALAGATDFALSPDGRRLAFTRDRSNRRQVVRLLGVYDLDTRRATLLDSTPRRNGFGAQWSPDGSHFAFQAMYPSRTAKGLRWGLALAPADARSCRMLSGTTPANDLDIWNFAWDPAEAKLLVMRSTAAGESLLTITAEGRVTGSEGLPLESPADTELSVSSGSQFALSPDGRSLAIVVDCYDRGLQNFQAIYPDGGYGALYVVDRRAQTARRVSPRTQAVQFVKPAWYGDSGRILYTAIEALTPLRSKSRPKPGLYRIPAPGGASELVVPGAEAGFLVGR